MSAGVLAGALAVLTGELAGRLTPGAGSPVLAVADAVIVLAPPSARDAGVSTFGTLDKPLLLAGVLLVCAALSAFAGLWHQRSRSMARALVVGLGVLAAAAVAADAGTTVAGGLVVGATVVVVGTVALALLLPVPARPLPALEDRRRFLLTAGSAGVLLVAGGGLLRLLDLRGTVDAARAALHLPRPVRVAPVDPATVALRVPGLSPLVTPNSRFYRIDTALVVPQVDPAGYRLSVDGMVDRPLTLSFDELLALPQVEADITISCVSNPVGGDLVGHARWQGVLLRDLLAQVGVRAGAGQVVGRSVDGFTAGFPLSYATDDRSAMVALGMNGTLLPVEHGFPARLVVPGLYGYVSATKWLDRITVTTWEGFDGFWVPRGWSKLGPIKLTSRIDVPADGTTVETGPVTVAGVAWAPGPGRGISAVEVRVDGAGPWLPAELGGVLSDEAWRQWRLRWVAPPGEHLLEVRARDGAGALQDARVMPPRPDGATGLHAVRVLAR